MDFKFGRYIHMVHPNKSPLNILEKGERGHIQMLPKLFGYPKLSQEVLKLQTSNLAGTFGENGAWEYSGTVQIFWVPPIISGTGKAMNFKFYIMHIHSINRKKSPLKLRKK